MFCSFRLWYCLRIRSSSPNRWYTWQQWPHRQSVLFYIEFKWIESNVSFMGQLYHACDSDYPQSYCLLNVNVLQFGDFYSAILAFWVTLVTLANMPDLCRAFFHLLGGILIAFTVETDRTSLWAFALPAGIGVAVLIISWVCHHII